MTYQDILYTVQDGVATLTLNQPDRFNASGAVMEVEIIDALGQAWRDDAVRVLVFTGTGPAFSAGGDAKGIVRRFLDADDTDQQMVRMAMGRRVTTMYAVMHFDKPIVAAINGVCAGAGFALPLICDLRIASDKARFGNIYMRRGTVPSMAPYFLPKAVGLGAAARLIFGDEVISAAEALRLGMVHEVVPHDRLMTRAMAVAREIAARPAARTRLAKRALWASWGQEFDEYREHVTLARGALGGGA